jgi:hypothetical protein
MLRKDDDDDDEEEEEEEEEEDADGDAADRLLCEEGEASWLKACSVSSGLTKKGGWKEFQCFLFFRHGESKSPEI